MDKFQDKSSNYYVHDYSNFSEEKFIHDFSEIDWSPPDDMSRTVDDNFDYFHSKTTSCMEYHLPKKRVTKRNLKLRTKPWIGSKIQNLFEDPSFPITVTTSPVSFLPQLNNTASIQQILS